MLVCHCLCLQHSTAQIFIYTSTRKRRKIFIFGSVRQMEGSTETETEAATAISYCFSFCLTLNNNLNLLNIPLSAPLTDDKLLWPRKVNILFTNVDDDDGANCGGAAVTVAATTADGLRRKQATAVSLNSPPTRLALVRGCHLKFNPRVELEEKNENGLSMYRMTTAANLRD